VPALQSASKLRHGVPEEEIILPQKRGEKKGFMNWGKKNSTRTSSGYTGHPE